VSLPFPWDHFAADLKYRYRRPYTRSRQHRLDGDGFDDMPEGILSDCGVGWYQVRRMQWNERLAAKAAQAIDQIIALDLSIEEADRSGAKISAEPSTWPRKSPRAPMLTATEEAKAQANPSSQ
jgi:hypothetical protein